MQDSHGVEGSGPVADHATCTLVGAEEPPHSMQSVATSCYAYPAMKPLRLNPGDAQYEKADSHPSNSQSSPQARDGELGSRPPDAPVDTSVHYVEVNTRSLIPTDMVSKSYLK